MDARLERNDSQDADAGEISIGDLVRGLWSARAWALGGLLLGVVVALCATIVSVYTQSSTTTYRQEIGFTLPDANSGLYPNGTAFSPNDLRSPVVLQTVYADAELESYGLSYAEFAAALTVTPSSALYQGVIERYRERLADNTLTFEERVQIEGEFGAAIGSTLSSGATVSLTLPNGLNVPNAVGRLVVASVPNVWADIYINQLGVTDFPVPGTTAELISSEFVESLDYPIAYDALESAFGELRQRISAIKQISGSVTLSDPDTGRTLFDVERDAERLEQFSLEHVLAPLTDLGLSKLPELTTAAYEYRTDEIEREIRLAEENARIIDSVLGIAETGSPATPPSMGSSSAPDQPFAQPSQAGGSVQQYGPELIDRLIGMSVENAGIDFRERMLEEKLNYESEAIQRTLERDQIMQRLALMDAESEPQDVQQLETLFVEESRELIESLNGLWVQVDNILREADLRRLNYDKQLFKPMPTVNAVETSARFVSRSTIVALVAAGFVGLVAGMAIFFITRIVGRRAEA